MSTTLPGFLSFLSAPKGLGRELAIGDTASPIAAAVFPNFVPNSFRCILLTLFPFYYIGRHALPKWFLFFKIVIRELRNGGFLLTSA